MKNFNLEESSSSYLSLAQFITVLQYDKYTVKTFKILNYNH